MQSSSKFDIIVYGATGSPQLVAEYLATQYRDDKQLNGRWPGAASTSSHPFETPRRFGRYGLDRADAGDVAP